MAETGNQVLRRYLEEAIAGRKSFEERLTQFVSNEGDDTEAITLWNDHLAQIRNQRDRLQAQLSALGGPASGRNPLTALLDLAARQVEQTYGAEERLLRHLTATYSGCTAEIAFYETLIYLARAAGDPETETLARAIQDEERIMAEKVWYLLPTRSKIAFNMLTVSELDPAVETKMADDRLGS